MSAPQAVCLAPCGAAPDARVLAALRTRLRACARGRAAAAGLAQVLPAILRHAAALASADRCGWLVLLRRCWRRQRAHMAPATCADLLALAAAWCDWPLVAAVGGAMPAGARTAGATLHLIEAYRGLGRAGAALELAVGLQLRHPGEADYARLDAELRAWCAWRGRMAAGGADGDGQELRLEPLAHHHLDDFAWQYYDPAIAELCCLPEFADALDWHHWLAAAWRAGDCLLHAVIHRDWGFVGCVSLVIHGDIGFFYYWIGRDFQGAGIGPRAGALQLDLAGRAYGLRCCYAKAFDYNLRSRRGLDKIGFVDLGIRGAGDDCDQLFLRRGPDQSRERTVAELHWLLERMDADVRAAVPLVAAHCPEGLAA